MRQTLITLLAVVTLLSQWGWVEHGYHHHDEDEVCEICVSASGHTAVLPAIAQLPAFQGHDDPVAAGSRVLYRPAVRFYPARAPPRSL
jgi:hypothetical protein